MSDLEKIPAWLKSLPLAPEYRPTETEFADPIAFISRIEREAAAFGICKVIPPLSKPSKKFVLSNLARSLSPDSAASAAAVGTRFTTRHQELGARKSSPYKRQVWQSGEFYTLEQFESKSKTFQRSQLSGFKEVTPLLVESLFWQATTEKPIYIEYCNDLPGSGFAVPEEPFLYRKKRRKVAEQGRSSVDEGTAGWKLSNSPWNLQAIARAPGSLTRFMPDEVPGVTSPMVYIAMLFSWFAWHIEDHELHSLNFLHMGAPKTWYAVPGEYASTLEEVIRMEGYGGDLDRLEAFTLLGEKTTLLSPEVMVSKGVPCCRLVQNPGEFVVTFPRAYHVGFSHGFNCGEAANFATPQWLKVAREAAVRRAAQNHLPMLSHQQLLYMLTVSFISRVPRALLSGVRSSRLKDRKREEREILVKKAFLNDMMNENSLLCTLLAEESTSHAVLWEPDLLPNPYCVPQSIFLSISPEVQSKAIGDGERRDIVTWADKDSYPLEENQSFELTAGPTSIPFHTHVRGKTVCHVGDISDAHLLEILDTEEDDLPLGLNIDSGTLPCVACGILGYPFMAIVQPSESVAKELFPVISEPLLQNVGKSGSSYMPSCLPYTVSKCPGGSGNTSREEKDPHPIAMVSLGSEHVLPLKGTDASDDHRLLSNTGPRGSVNMNNPCLRTALSNAIVLSTEPLTEAHGMDNVLVKRLIDEKMKGTVSNGFNRPRIFCLQHALEVEKLLRSKGGAHVLVICHSDYLKIKAYAPSIAEEVGMRFNVTDIPLESASPSELNLINVSIDDGEHEQNDEDWTSKVGMNLRYCMKLRKQSTLKKERLALALRRMFADPISLSEISNLKWHSKRSRTPYKVVGVSMAKSYINTKLAKGNIVERNFNANFTSKVKDKHSCKMKPYDFKAFKEFCGSNVRLNKNNCCTASCSHHLDEKVEDGNAEGLFSVPISAAEDVEVHQDSWFPLEVSAADEDATDCHKIPHHSLLIPVFESSSTCEGMNSQGTKYKGDDSDESDSQSNLLQLVAMDCEVQQDVEGLNEINLEDKSDDNGGSTMESTLEGDSRGLLDSPVMLEPTLCSGSHNLLLPADQSCAPAVLFDNADMNIEASCSNEPSMEVSMVYPLNSGEKMVRNLSGTEVEDAIEDAGNHSSRSIEHIVRDLSTVDQCDMQQEEISYLDMQITEVRKMEGNVDLFCGPDIQIANDLPTADSSTMRQESSITQEYVKDEGYNHPSWSGRLLVCNLSTVETGGMGQKETSSADDNLSGVSNGQLQVRQFTDTHMADSSDVHEEMITTNETTIKKVHCLDSVVDCGSLNFGGVNSVSVGESFEGLNSVKKKDHLNESCDKNLKTACIIHYVRRRTKRKQEEQSTEQLRKRSGGVMHNVREDKHIAQGSNNNCNDFVRGPCEGLRPRCGQAMTSPVKLDLRTAKQNKALSKVKRRAGKGCARESYGCEIDGCRVKFRSKEDLDLHMLDRCTYKGCSKQFNVHEELMRHQQDHDAERPLKCPWKGCGMSFKWEWARTEHIRLHTGERPYQCTVSGCEMTFRYVSAFSRHRRKTGHCVNTTDN